MNPYFGLLIVLLLGSTNLRFNLFWNEDLRCLHHEPFKDWLTGWAQRFLASLVAVALLLYLTDSGFPLTWVTKKLWIPTLGLTVLANCIISYIALLKDIELIDWACDENSIPPAYLPWFLLASILDLGIYFL